MKKNNIEVRLCSDGKSIDELLIYDYEDRCLFHMEMMNVNYYWIRAYGITQDLVAYIGATNGLVPGNPIGDEKGVCSEYEMSEGPVVFSNFEWDDTIYDNLSCKEKEDKTTETSDILNKYGIVCVLKDIVDIYKKGRNEFHDQIFIKELNDSIEKFIKNEKDYDDMQFIIKDDAKNL